MGLPLGASGGDLRIVAEQQTYFLPLIQAGARDVPAGTTTERAYVNPRRNPPRARTTPGGPGEYSFTYDKNASAAIQALRRANRTQAVVTATWISNDVDQVVKGAAGSTLVLAAAAGGNPALVTFAGASSPDLTGAEFDSGMFLCVGAAADDYDICYVIDRIVSAKTAYVHRVGAVAGAKGAQTVTPDATYTPATVIGSATTFWQLVVPAEAAEFQATVSQIGGSAIEQEAQEDTVVLSLSADAVEKYFVDEALNAPVDA